MKYCLPRSNQGSVYSVIDSARFGATWDTSFGANVGGRTAELSQNQKKNAIEPNPGTKMNIPRFRCPFVDP